MLNTVYKNRRKHSIYANTQNLLRSVEIVVRYFLLYVEDRLQRQQDKVERFKKRYSHKRRCNSLKSIGKLYFYIKGISIKIMSAIHTYIALFFFGIIVVFCAKKMGHVLSLLDTPDGQLKKHTKQIPSTGGLGVITSVAIGMALTFQSSLTTQNIIVILFLLAIFILGMLDDELNLSISSRLFIQLILVSVLLFFITPLDISGILLLDFITTALFFIACINAMNIIDIMDGLAGGVAFFAVLNCLLLLNNDTDFYTVISICTLISLLSFLVFNFNPATIFLGDAGSTFLGGLIATLVVILFQQSTTIQGKISSLFPIAVIFFELIFVVIVRINKGLNPMKGSPDHLPLRIRKLGFSVKETVFMIYVFAAFSCALSIMVIFAAWPLLILILVIFCLFLFFIALKMSKITME